MNNNDGHDELTGIFDHITPADFSPEAGPNRGKEAFDKFFETNLQSIRMAWVASDGHLNPVAVLADSTTQITLVPTDDETLGEYVNRVRGEAHRLGAHWLFISRKTLVGNWEAKSSDDIPDTSDPEAIQKALEDGLLGEGMFFYGERLEAGERHSRHGLMKVKNDNLQSFIEGSSEDQSVDFFKGILG